MKHFLLLLAAFWGLSFGTTPFTVHADEPAATPKTRIVIIGDSTVCFYKADAPKRGWGMFLPDYFDTNRVEIINLALSGRSTKTFITQGHWKEALAKKPDYVLIQFGHNDSHSPDHPEATDSKTAFREYLRQYIDESRAIGAKPVLITPMCRRNFDADGHIKNELLPYADAMKAVATEKNVPLVDLNATSVALCNQLGPKESLTLACDSKDSTHFSAKGAKEMARLVMEQLPTTEPSLKPYTINH